ncbi:MAG: hypothetical protein KME26_28130 [Oscillatoria princeps RMCB-10]|jgi:hypothetical protein|nr:hypothetical protein [Oscillatoria princeps RMCB-10]
MANALSGKHLRQSISFAYHSKGERSKNGSGKKVMMSVAESLVKQGLARDESLLLYHYPKNFLTLQLWHKTSGFSVCGPPIVRRNAGVSPHRHYCGQPAGTRHR